MPAPVDRDLLVRGAVAAIMMPFQIALMLLFASGGMMLLLLLGLAVLPFAALVVGARRLLRSVRQWRSTRAGSVRDS